MAPGWFPEVGDTFVPPLKAVAELRGIVGSHGEERGGAAVVAVTVTVTWLLPGRPQQGGSAPHSQRGSSVVAVDVEFGRGAAPAPPCQSPEPGSCSSPRPAQSLVKPCHQPCFDPRNRDPTNLGCAGEKMDTERAQRALALQPGAAWQRGSSSGWDTLPALPSSLWLFSTPPRTLGSGIFCLGSLPAMLGVLGSSRWADGWWRALPWHRLLLTAVGMDGIVTSQGVPIAAKSPHPALSSLGRSFRMDSPFPRAGRKRMLQPCSSPGFPQRFSMRIWTEALQTHFLPRGRPLMGTGLARGHPARLPNVRSSGAPRCLRGPPCPPCADPVCSFLMSSRAGWSQAPSPPRGTSEAPGGAGSG